MRTLLIGGLALSSAFGQASKSTVAAGQSCIDTIMVNSTTGAIYYCVNGTFVQHADGGASALPTGAIVMISSGSCPTGFAEATELNGVTVIGTLSSKGDVGTTGGADT